MKKSKHERKVIFGIVVITILPESVQILLRSTMTRKKVEVDEDYGDGVIRTFLENRRPENLITIA